MIQEVPGDRDQENKKPQRSGDHVDDGIAERRAHIADHHGSSSKNVSDCDDPDGRNADGKHFFPGAEQAKQAGRHRFKDDGRKQRKGAAGKNGDTDSLPDPQAFFSL